MLTGLFELFQSTGNKQAVAAFLQKASFDELLEWDMQSDHYHRLAHFANKYAFPPAKETFREVCVRIADMMVHPDERARFVALISREQLERRLAESPVKGVICEEFRFRMMSGSWCWVELAILSGEEFDMPAHCCRIYVFDIRARKARELGERIEPLSFTDSRNETTGLLRRKEFMKSVGSLLKNTLVKWCLIALDIENFKLFNEWYGHSEGDLLMMQIGVMLRRACEEQDGTAGYFGQDDFFLLIPYDMEKIESLYVEISELIGARGSVMSFMPAFGICIVDEDCGKLRDMLDRAALAARYAKKSYHSRIRIFDKTMYRRTDKEYRILSDFFQAMKQNEIVFYLQPQCRVSTGKIVGAEALARWIKPDGTVVPPNVFIPVLEKHGLITDLDLYIWEAVCRWQRNWIDRGNNPLPLSVNVSAMDILNTDLTAAFTELTAKYDLPHELLKIEITESAYIDNTSLVKNTIQGLQEQHFSVLIDDFGSGYSTLNVLKNLNVDVIKLDAQLLNMDASNEKKSIRILESVTTMTKTLGIPVIVEGVETEQQKAFLKDLGCGYIQGYYYYRPTPVENYEKLIADPGNTDFSGITFKANRQFHLREILDNSIYSDNMLNNILGPSAFYAREGEHVSIIRFNEQFYEAANASDFQQKLQNIEQLMPPADRTQLLRLMTQAEADRLNGARGMLHYYHIDGMLHTFNVRLFYLNKEGDKKIYYGSVQDITRLSILERQMALLSHSSPDTVVFLRRKPDGKTRLSVLFNGLESMLGMTQSRLEAELNRIGMEDGLTVFGNIREKIKRSEAFATLVTVKAADGSPLQLRVYGDYVHDDSGILDYILTFRATDAEAEPADDLVQLQSQTISC